MSTLKAEFIKMRSQIKDLEKRVSGLESSSKTVDALTKRVDNTQNLPGSYQTFGEELSGPSVTKQSVSVSDAMQQHRTIFASNK